ncbi:hypothetical protein BJ085DRAFT_37261 [Dimargaris cristalligena]|uniref:PH domain-containing protein n=1 Tax=Dimargaris cristalligena TaxID=215637 RepID=A0A4P9ZXQ8_9FUNG|nr:hypothetical protein BJ085DRAFT_37261 [Dimargaris cristalligena]|eukprot:RKP38456.1 hypothetical protein BJ085DRAFT_37261 [Dimargaris cristalligena]
MPLPRPDANDYDYDYDYDYDCNNDHYDYGHNHNCNCDEALPGPFAACFLSPRSLSPGPLSALPERPSWCHHHPLDASISANPALVQTIYPVGLHCPTQSVLTVLPRLYSTPAYLTCPYMLSFIKDTFLAGFHKKPAVEGAPDQEPADLPGPAHPPPKNGLLRTATMRYGLFTPRKSVATAPPPPRWEPPPMSTPPRVASDPFVVTPSQRPLAHKTLSSPASTLPLTSLTRITTPQRGPPDSLRHDTPPVTPSPQTPSRNTRNRRSRRSSIHGTSTVSAPLLKREELSQPEIPQSTADPHHKPKEVKPPSGIFYVRVVQLEYIGPSKSSAFQCVMEVGQQSFSTDVTNPRRVDKNVHVAQYPDVFVFDILHPFTFKLSVLPKPLLRSNSAAVASSANRPPFSAGDRSGPVSSGGGGGGGPGGRFATPSRWFQSLANRRSRSEGQVLSELYLDFGFRRLSKETKTYNMPLLTLSSSEMLKRSLEVTLEVGVVIEHDPFHEDGKYSFPAKPWLKANGYTDSVRTTIHKSRLSYTSIASSQRISMGGTSVNQDRPSSSHASRAPPIPTHFSGHLSLFVRSGKGASWKRFWMVMDKHSLILFHPEHREARPKCGRISLIHLTQVHNPTSEVINLGPYGLELAFSPLSMTDKQRRQSAFPHPVEIKAARQIMLQESVLTDSPCDVSIDGSPASVRTHTSAVASVDESHLDLDQILETMNITEEDTQTFYSAWRMRVYILADDAQSKSQWKTMLEQEIRIVRQVRTYQKRLQRLQQQPQQHPHSHHPHHPNPAKQRRSSRLSGISMPSFKRTVPSLLARPSEDSRHRPSFAESERAFDDQNPMSRAKRRQSRTFNIPLLTGKSTAAHGSSPPLRAGPKSPTIRQRNMTSPVPSLPAIKEGGENSPPMSPLSLLPANRFHQHRRSQQQLNPNQTNQQQRASIHLERLSTDANLAHLDLGLDSDLMVQHSARSSKYKQDIVRILDHIEVLRDKRRKNQPSLPIDDAPSSVTGSLPEDSSMDLRSVMTAPSAHSLLSAVSGGGAPAQLSAHALTEFIPELDPVEEDPLTSNRQGTDTEAGVDADAEGGVDQDSSTTASDATECESHHSDVDDDRSLHPADLANISLDSAQTTCSLNDPVPRPSLPSACHFEMPPPDSQLSLPLSIITNPADQRVTQGLFPVPSNPSLISVASSQLKAAPSVVTFKQDEENLHQPHLSGDHRPFHAIEPTPGYLYDTGKVSRRFLFVWNSTDC